ncbi:hypothetical protein GCM10022197_05330 [Microlunatus spumicola]|uniref:Magnesium transporter NIPA n=1 Tax=Microlunatus spumicola TaxID=81499 RepID=A0ABP6WMR7_9ACTN
MLAAALALAAAAVFGTATALQHRSASAVAEGSGGSGRLLARLLRSPGWVVGLCLSGVAFALHVAALHEGSLTLVQPIVVTTTVFAVFVRSALDRTLPDRAEVVWAVCTWAGLTLFVLTAGTRRPGFVTDDRLAALFLVVAVVAAAVAIVVAGQLHVPARRGFFLGVAAGILYGSTAGLVKLATSYGRGGVVPLLHHWSAWLVAPVGLTAFFLSQRAFQASRLSVSVPVLNIVDVLVAVGFGSVVFREHLFRSPGQLLVELVGATMIVVGVWQLVKEGERLHESHLREVPAGSPPAPR